MYHAQTATDAQVLAELLGNNSDNFLAPHGTHLHILARALGAKMVTPGTFDDDCIRYEFEDDSVIIVTGAKWRVA